MSNSPKLVHAYVIIQKQDAASFSSILVFLLSVCQSTLTLNFCRRLEQIEQRRHQSVGFFEVMHSAKRGQESESPQHQQKLEHKSAQSNQYWGTLNGRKLVKTLISGPNICRQSLTFFLVHILTLFLFSFRLLYSHPVYRIYLMYACYKDRR